MLRDPVRYTAKPGAAWEWEQRMKAAWARGDDPAKPQPRRASIPVRPVQNLQVSQGRRRSVHSDWKPETQQ